MDFDKREIGMFVLLLVLLLIFWRNVSTYTDTTFRPSMSLGEAETLHNKAADAISAEMTKKLDDANATNDLAIIKKVGDEGHDAILKLQTAYHNFLKGKGLTVVEETRLV